MFVDDDEYLEYIVAWDEPEPSVLVDEDDTEPLASRAEHLLHAPAEVWHWGHLPLAGDDPVDSWHSLLDDELPQVQTEPPIPSVPERPPVDRPEPVRESWRSIHEDLLSDAPLRPAVEPIGFAHNGFHVDDEQRFQPFGPPDPPSRHQRTEESESSGDIGSHPADAIPTWIPTTPPATDGTPCPVAISRRAPLD